MTKKYNFKYQITTDTNNGKGFSEDELKTTIEKSRITGGSDGLFVASIVRNNTHKPYYEVDTDFFILKMKIYTTSYRRFFHGGDWSRTISA